MLEAYPPSNFSLDTLEQIRASVGELVRAIPVPDVAVLVEDRWIEPPEHDQKLRIIVYRPENSSDSRPCLLHIHGGGYVIGVPELNDARNRELAVELDCVVVSVDYRLAPEHPHPQPVEDCYAALKWVHQHAGSLGIDSTRIAIGGESAGGGLAAALAILARDRGEVSVLYQLLIYPMLDDRTVVAPTHPFSGEFMWTPSDNQFGWSALLGKPPGSDDVSQYAAAARAGTLRGLPPAFISIGALDLFIEENLEYARRLIRDGVSVELHVYPGAVHGFNVLGGAAVSKRFERDYRLALRLAMHPVQGLT